MGILNKFKKVNKFLTVDELENYKNRCLELKSLIEKESKNKNFTLVSKYMQEYSKIVRILKKANKSVKNARV